MSWALYSPSEASNLRTHLKIHRQMQPKIWLCLFPCRQFEDIFENAQWWKVKQMQLVWLCLSRAGLLRTHLQTHSGEKTNKCYQCDYDSGRRFQETFENSQWTQVKQMQPMHWLHLFDLWVCDYACSDPTGLRSHLKTHSGRKSNKCNQNDYASSNASNLRWHFKTHSGEKPNKCNQCNYASFLEGNLRTHFKSHSGKKSN